MKKLFIVLVLMLSGCTALNDHQKDTEESILTAGDAAEIVRGETPPEVSPSEQELKKYMVHTM